MITGLFFPRNNYCPSHWEPFCFLLLAPIIPLYMNIYYCIGFGIWAHSHWNFYANGYSSKATASPIVPILHANGLRIEIELIFIRSSKAPTRNSATCESEMPREFCSTLVCSLIAVCHLEVHSMADDSAIIAAHLPWL